MADTMTKAQRHAVMSHIRSRDTKPEKLLRSLVHRQGFRFRICRKDLPGRPDLVLRRHRTCVFVHGCFWHRHAGCRLASMPKDNADYWQAKFERNQARDRANVRELLALGWNVVVVWECRLRHFGEADLERLCQLIREGGSLAEPRLAVIGGTPEEFGQPARPASQAGSAQMRAETGTEAGSEAGTEADSATCGAGFAEHT